MIEICEGYVEIYGKPDMIIDEAANIINKVSQYLSKKYGGSEEETFEAIWRYTKA